MIAPPRPPSHDENEALIREARARQLRRRLLGAAGVAISAAIGLGVYALAGGGAPGGLVGEPASAGRATGPPCRASQLSTSIGLQGATGSLLGGASIENTSGSACSLPGGRPTVAITASGETLRVREQVPPHAFPGSRAHVLTPGAKALVWMQWLNWCGKPSSASTFDLRFRGGLELSASEHGEPRCDSSQSPSIVYVSALLQPQ